MSKFIKLLFSNKKPEETKGTKKCRGCFLRIPVYSDECPNCKCARFVYDIMY